MDFRLDPTREKSPLSPFLNSFGHAANLADSRRWVSAFSSALASTWEILSVRSGPMDATRQVVRLLTRTLDARDSDTGSHTRRVSQYCDLLVAEMQLAVDVRQEVVLAGLLHDIGKIGVPDRVLRKPSALSHSEWAEMRAHTDWGYEMVRSVSALEPVAALLRFHHERWDGEGYPNRLAGNAIPLGARIIAVADAFDAMTSDRPYRNALSFGDAYARIVGMAGVQFDPAVVDAFRSCIRPSPLVVSRPSWPGLTT